MVSVPPPTGEARWGLKLVSRVTVPPLRGSYFGD